MGQLGDFHLKHFEIIDKDILITLKMVTDKSSRAPTKWKNGASLASSDEHLSK